MKELSIEQKAKRYDEAIERAKSKIKNNKDHVLYEDDVIDIFPELYEPDDDRTRKELIKLLRNLFNNYSYFIKDPFYTECINWLEKQGEQSPNILWHDVSEEPDEKREIFCEWKSSTGVWHSVVFYHADSKTFCEGERIITNVLQWTYVNDLLGKQREQKTVDEPRLKVEEGKWYVCISQFCNCIEGRVYKATSDNRIIDDFGTEYDMHNDAYKYFRPWSIKDAKDGDILRLGDVIAIFKKYIGQEECICYCSFCDNCYCSSCVNVGFEIPIENGVDNVYGCTNTTPATKEQRDLLFQKMEESGHEWDADKKELVEQMTDEEHKQYILEHQDETIYDMSFEEAQDFISKRGFDIPWNDGDVMVDERKLTQTVANVLKWADRHPLILPVKKK